MCEKYLRSNVEKDKEYDCVFALIIKGGVDHGFAGKISGELIQELEDVVEKICDYQNLRDVQTK